MKNIILFKAEGQEIANANISITASIPDKGLAELQELFASEAKLLSDILWESLPSGTIDHLLVNLMERKASYLKVNRS